MPMRRYFSAIGSAGPMAFLTIRISVSKGSVGEWSALSGMKNVAAMGEGKGDVPLSGNEPVKPKKVVTIHSKHPDQVRAGEF
jgi:hypothetical protein